MAASAADTTESANKSNGDLSQALKDSHAPQATAAGLFIYMTILFKIFCLNIVTGS